MQTTDPDAVFPEPTPLGPTRGHLTLVFLAVVLIGLVGASLLGPPDDDGELSGAAPEVVLDGFDGEQWRLSEHLVSDGRPVVLNLWASWCLPCRDEIPELSAFATAHPDIAVVGVAVNDTVSEARRLADELDPAYLVGMDATGRLRDRYPSVGMPFTVLIAADGTIAWSRFGGVTSDELAAAVQDAVPNAEASRNEA